MDEKRKAELRGLCGKHGINEIIRAAVALPELLDDNDAKDREIERLTAELAASESRANAAVDDLAKIYQIALNAHENCALADVIDLAWDVMCYVPAEARGVQEPKGETE